MCPVCGYAMQDPPSDYNICPSCGTEFGVSDVNSSVEVLRQVWVATGAHWWSTTEPIPENWNATVQLMAVLVRETKVQCIRGYGEVEISSVTSSSSIRPPVGAAA
jgi:hypothetical protein